MKDMAQFALVVTQVAPVEKAVRGNRWKAECPAISPVVGWGTTAFEAINDWQANIVSDAIHSFMVQKAKMVERQ